VRTPGERVLVPVNSLLFRSEGLRAVVIGSDDRAHLQPLSIGPTSAPRWKWSAA